MKSNLLAVIVVLAVALSGWGVLPTLAAPEATLTWDGSASNNWNTAANWTPAQVPTALDNIIIGNSNVNNQPTLNAGTTVANLTINGRSQTMNTRGGCLTINAGVTLNVTGNVAINGSSGGNTGVTCNGIANRTGIVMNTTAGMTVGGNVTLANSTGGPPEEAMIVMGSGTLQVAGNLTKGSASVFTAGTGTVIFNSTGTQNLTVNSATAFNNLTVNNGVTLIETVAADNATVAGTLTNSGTIRKTQNVVGVGARTFGLAGAYNGAALSVNVTTQATLSSLQVDRIDANHPNATSGAGSTGTATGRYWTITPTGGGYTVNLTLPHNINPNANADVCEYTAGAGFGWDCARTSSTANTVTRNGVTTLSPWAVGNSTGPTAVLLENISAQSVSNGWGLLLAVLALLISGSLVWTLARRKAN